MDNFALVDTIRTYCEDNSIVFIYGNEQYANALADSNEYAEDQLILIADFNAIPTIENSAVQSIRYSGVLSLGLKTETVTGDTTVSSIDETPEQKYDRRLQYLCSQLVSIIGDLACDNELEVSGLNFRMDLNKFDISADFVATSIDFIQGNE